MINTFPAEEAARQAEASVADAERMLQEASDALEEVKKKGGVAHGAIWWMERTLTGLFLFLLFIFVFVFVCFCFCFCFC